MKTKNLIKLECLIWNKESHGLFDYESKECKHFNFILQPDLKVYRQGESIVVHQELIQNDDTVLLGEFMQDEDGQIIFKPVKRNNKDQDAYLKLCSDKQTGNIKYSLHKNDLIKLGRVEYFVSEVQQQDCNLMVAEDVFGLDGHLSVNLNSETFACKFCLIEGCQDLNNPYLSKLCKCQGNIEFVHFECLREWVNSRVDKKQTQNTVMYAWKRALECELCQEPLPKRIFVNQNLKPLELIQIERLPFPYVLLEQITRENGQSKSLVLVHGVNNGQVLIGRGNACEIRSYDISVSRMHATIKWEETEDTWYIEDQNSKFGTLMILNGNVNVEVQYKEIQIGRVVLKMKMIQNYPYQGSQQSKAGQEDVSDK